MSQSASEPEDPGYSAATLARQMVSTNEALRVKEHEARTACQKLEGMLEQAETMLGAWGLPT